MKVTDFPEDWIEIAFEEFANIQPKINLKKGDLYSFTPMEDIDAGNKFAKPKILKAYSGGGAKFSNGDTLFARITPCLENGKIAQAKELDTKNGFGSTEYFIFRGKEHISDSDFIYYLSKTQWFQQNAINSMVGASGRQRADVKFVGKTLLSLPLLPTQQKIAHTLSAYDELIENNLKRIKLLEEMAQITYEQWFVRMRFPGYETIPVDAETGLPEEWVNMPLNKAINVNPTTKITNKQESPFVPMGSLSTNSMVIDDIKLRIPSGGAKFINGDTLVARITPCLENGKTGFVNFLKDEQVASGSTEYIVLRETLNVNRYFIYCMSRSEYFRELSIRSMAGSDGRQRVNPKIYNKMMLLIPSSKVMELFGKKTRPIFDVIYSLVNQNQLLKEARDILLPRLMTGIINVDHIELPIPEQDTEAA